MTAPAPTQDASAKHWIYRLPKGWIPYAQLSRLDRAVGYWLLALPGWMGLAFAGLNYGLSAKDLVWVPLILMGAIAMRGAGCTYNDIVDRDLDAKVARTSLRPIPAGNVTVKHAKMWMFAQIGIGFLVWLCLPLFAKFIALLSLPLVAAYPFMKRITWWPQIWLGLTFNWAFLVAVAIKTGTISWPSLIFYLGLIFWTVGYDTIYALQDVEDDALIGVKSTARRFGKRVRLGVGLCFTTTIILICTSISLVRVTRSSDALCDGEYFVIKHPEKFLGFGTGIIFIAPLIFLFAIQIFRLQTENPTRALRQFKNHAWFLSAFLLWFLPWAYLIYVFSGGTSPLILNPEQCAALTPL